MSKHYPVIPRQRRNSNNSLGYYPHYCRHCHIPFETYDSSQQFCCEECKEEHLARARNMNILSLIGNGLVHMVQRVFSRTETETIVEQTPYGTRTITKQVNVSVTQTEIIRRKSR